MTRVLPERPEDLKQHQHALGPMKESDEKGIMADWMLRKNVAEEVYLMLNGKEKREKAIKAWDGSPGVGT